MKNLKKQSSKNFVQRNRRIKVEITTLESTPYNNNTYWCGTLKYVTC